MKAHKVSDKLQVEAATEWEKPYLVIRDLSEADGGDPLRVIIYPHEVQALIAALTDATVHLVNEMRTGR